MFQGLVVNKNMAALVETLSESVGQLKCSRDTTAPVRCGQHTFEACTSIGLRPTQEDRFTLVPHFFRPDCAFAGVFDGTVGDDASEFANQNFVSHLCANLDVHSGAQGSIFTEAAAVVTTADGAVSGTTASTNTDKASGGGK